MGHRLQVTENSGRQVNYSYDDLYRLTQEQITDSVNGNRTYGYSYDKVSNRLSKTETIAGNTTTTNYAYDANDRLLSETGATNATYLYDNNGNTLSKTENGLTTTYIWNSEPAPRMIGAVTTDINGVVTQQMSYQYDADGMRVSATVNGEETRYLLDVVQPYPQVREEYSPDGTVKVSYVYGNDLIQQTRGTDTTYYHVDGLGSTRVLTDTQGQVVAAYNFDAYGELINSTGTAANNYLFAGEQYDANLGDYYLRQRYYSPGTGRFGRRDTWEGSLTDPMSLHKYGYAHGNPVSFVDPSGLMSTSQVLGTIALVGFLASMTIGDGVVGILTGDVSGLDPTWGLGPHGFGGDDLVGLFQQIPFKPYTYKVVAEAASYRSINRTPFGRNIAVVVYKNPITQKLETFSVENLPTVRGKDEMGLHSEYMIFSAITKLNIRPKDIVAIYSELEPCSNCAQTLRQLVPNAGILWSFPYNNGRGQRYLDGQVEKEFSFKVFDLNPNFTF